MKVERRHRSRFALEMAIVLVVKIAALALIWSVWFADPMPRHLRPERIGTVVYSTDSAAPPPEAMHARP